MFRKQLPANASLPSPAALHRIVGNGAMLGAHGVGAFNGTIYDSIIATLHYDAGAAPAGDSAPVPFSTDGDDVIFGSGGQDFINGGGGNDLIYGRGGPDFIDGETGNDQLYGGDDNDWLTGGPGDDILVGEAGIDTLLGSEGNDIMYSGTDAGTCQGGPGDDYYFVDVLQTNCIESPNEGFDVIFVSTSFEFAPSLHSSAIEVITTILHADTTPIDISGNEYGQTLLGNAGTNYLKGLAGDDSLYGFDGADFLYGGTGADTLDGGAFDDTLFGDEDNDILYGAGGMDQLYGGTGADRLEGGDDNDILVGDGGNDMLIGGAGNDRLFGLAGDDQMSGGMGDDYYFATDAGDTASEASGEGFDAVYASVSYALAAGSEIEFLSTITHSDTATIDLTGNDIGNVVMGNAGANTLNGLGGNDTLYGLGGADTFAFTTALGAGNVDQIADFQAGTDRIALNDAIFATLAPGALAPGAFVVGSAAGDADDRIIYDSTTGALLYDADGNGSGLAVQFATLTPGLPLTVSDFQVI